MTERLCRIAVVAALVMAAASVVSAQDTRPAEQVYKNIKVMTGVPAHEVIQGMHLIKAALGVECTHCHIEMQWDRDDVPLKETARRMFVMMTDINRTQFGGRPVVTCYTCHKGQAIPADIPPLPVPATKAEGGAAKVALPAVEQVLARYIAALGGEAAMRKVATRVISATQDIPTGPGGVVPMPATLERSMKAPNLIVDVYKTDTFTLANGFDGTAAWARGQNGNVTSPAPGGVDAERAARAAAFNEPLTLAQEYRALAVSGVEKVNGHDTYVVTAVPAANTPERLYFDVQTGLLLRKWTYVVSAVGRSPFQMDFDDYRDTGSGVKIPWVVHLSPAGVRTEMEPTSTLRVTRVRDNVPVDDAVFAKPAPLRPAAPARWRERKKGDRQTGSAAREIP